MPTEVILPKVDMDMATGRISRWLVADGDTVAKGAPLFEIETDKAAMEVDAPADGTLRRVKTDADADIPVGQAVGWIYGDGEAVPDAGSAGAGSDEAPQAEAVEPAHPAKAEASPDAAAPSGRLAPAAEERPQKALNGAVGHGVRATPLARRLAREAGLDLAALTGSGPKGRIQREDVEAAATAKGAGAALTQSADRQPVPPASKARASLMPAEPAAPAPDAGPLHAVWMREGTGVPVVLLHGFGAELGSWRPLLAEIPEGVPVLGVDLPGHGGSVDVAAAGFADLVAAVEASLTALGVTSAHLVAHSLGGAVAAAVAAGTAIETRSLLLIASAGLGPDVHAGFIKGFAAATEEAPIRAWMGELVFDPRVLSDAFVRSVTRSRADGRLAAAQSRLAERLFVGGAQSFSVRGELAGLGCPVKLIVGEADRIIASRHAFGLAPHVALHLFAATGHMPQLERRLEVGRLLRELLR
ncbi:acetoin dehydrogenase dihydrolipoyllysine-residue acetyltransferase subunit [Jiella sp. MQZ9-1]|uniref:Acetoin dehydrogenase dihydrolipoyllysine-residue acetyltransferase subunit n=1 Tax=Jiella flava TaxID=2816857 RepID=A0A939G2Q8_9HYPH|nr:acetoin dehydrogenase dihydrolipoyllysine-residue acetyltransferase subunit [Jiella flava]MBO0664142.1 acetoin dehydrogenase dihydrolipoyllysine-residue acetyltransferase subunit [Jiella flava]MCD2472714.1 acetoin dehydrogenase dihydrolipoyllysine-residue acetyltransferase subunit [Jiella flava]